MDARSAGGKAVGAYFDCPRVPSLLVVNWGNCCLMICKSSKNQLPIGKGWEHSDCVYERQSKEQKKTWTLGWRKMWTLGCNEGVWQAPWEDHRCRGGAVRKRPPEWCRGSGSSEGLTWLLWASLPAHNVGSVHSDSELVSPLFTALQWWLPVYLEPTPPHPPTPQPL